MLKTVKKKEKKRKKPTPASSSEKAKFIKNMKKRQALPSYSVFKKSKLSGSFFLTRKNATLKTSLIMSYLFEYKNFYKASWQEKRWTAKKAWKRQYLKTMKKWRSTFPNRMKNSYSRRSWKNDKFTANRTLNKWTKKNQSSSWNVWRNERLNFHRSHDNSQHWKPKTRNSKNFFNSLFLKKHEIPNYEALTGRVVIQGSVESVKREEERKQQLKIMQEKEKARKLQEQKQGKKTKKKKSANKKKNKQKYVPSEPEIVLPRFFNEKLKTSVRFDWKTLIKLNAGTCSQFGKKGLCIMKWGLVNCDLMHN